MALFIKAAVLLAAVAAPLAPHSTLYSDGTPPDRFQKDGAAIVMFVSTRDQMDAICGKAPPGLKTMACTHMEDGKPAIVTMANPCGVTYDYYAHLLCHEMGHVNGWPRTHGD
jgi:hypothetical protein